MHVPTLIAQYVSAIYTPCKDAILYFKDERQHIKDLEEKISDLITNVNLIKSKKETIDRSLRNSVYIEKSEAYQMMEEKIKVVHNKYIKFIEKYTKITKNPLSLTTESLMISELENLKSEIWTFNFFKLAKLSRNIAKLNTRACEVLERLEPKFMIQNKLEPIQEKLDDNNNLPVFNTYVDEVLGCLYKKGNKVVGIFGPIGVGKTTVLKKLYNQLIERKSLYHGDSSSQLDYVILTEYPQELETREMIVQKLQIEIMGQLNIDHEASNTSVQKNGNAISTFLSGKRYILLMDHVPFEIDLGDLGLKEDHKYKKVVIASSDRKTINRMTDHVVEIQTLVHDEARTLFEIACGKINIDGRKRDIAERIIECCAGIPWMIDNVAKHLSNKSHEDSWNEVQRYLQSDSSSLGLIGLGGMDMVYKMMYEELQADTKKCLLYGALFPNHYKIYRDYLIECWIAEGFLIKDDFKKVRRSRDRGQTILDLLTDRHLLNWCSDQMYVQMPLNFRRVALELDYPDSTNCVTWVPSNDREPDEQLWSGVTRMSLIGCKTKLPESPKCSNICTLLLQSLKPKLEKLAHEFFLDMKKLQILDLNHTEIRALPSSIDRVPNLKSLYLNDCNHLETLPPQAANLVKLEFLDISETSITSLPEEIISCMVELRCLRASCSANSRGNEVRHRRFELIIPQGIISKLKKLEELSIVTTLDCEGGISVATEMASLEHLHTLRFNFPNVTSVDTFVDESESLKNLHTFWEAHTFRSYKIFIGRHETDQHPYESVFSGTLADRWLRYSTHEEFSAACKDLLNQASAFELIGNEKVDSLSHFDMNSVKVCVVASCKKLKSIVDGYMNREKETSSAPLELEKLYLYDLQLLQHICVGADHSQRLSNLTALTINGCPNLTKILDPALAHALQSLQYLKVENCSEVSEIVEAVGKSEIVEVLEGSSNSEQAAEPSHMLKSLRIIELTKLPKLQSICNTSINSWNSLNSIIIISCPELRNLSLSSENAKKLAVIECEKNLWDSLQLPDELNRQNLCQFCHFTEESSTTPEPSQMEKNQRVEDPILIGRQAAAVV